INSRVRIHVVDDEAGIRHKLKLILTDEGYEVFTETDGEEALRMALSEKPEMILCDIRMPKLDGLRFVERYQEAGGGALIIMMSAYGTRESAIDAMRLEAYDYVSQPLNVAENLRTSRK